MPVVPFSISPFGTGTLETGAGNIAITSGVATTSVAQTGNIGIGTMFEYNSINCLITAVNSTTSFNVIDVDGTATPDQASTAITSVHHVWASQSAMEAAFTGATFLNTSNLVTGTLNVSCECYYDHDDSTKDTTTFVTQFGTTNATYFLTYRSPRGGTESNNDQFPADGIFDSTKFYGGADTLYHEVFQDFTVIDNIQFEGVDSSTTVSMERDEITVRNCIFEMVGGPAIDVQDFGGGFDMHIYNNTINNTTSGSNGIIVNNGTALISFNTIKGFSNGINEPGGTATPTSNAIFINTDDFNSVSGTIDYNASDDGDGTNAVTFSGGATDYAANFKDYTATPPDLDLKDFSGSNAIGAAGNPVAGITTDLLGRARDGSTPSIGAFEMQSSGPSVVAVTVVDSLGVTDTLTTYKTMQRVIADAGAITDTVVMKKTMLRVVADSLGITETVVSFKTMLRVVTDALGVTETVVRGLSGQLLRTITDALGVTETVVSFKTMKRSVADSVGITEVLTRSKAALRNITDSVGVTETLATIKTMLRVIADSVGVTEVISTSAEIIKRILITIKSTLQTVFHLNSEVKTKLDIDSEITTKIDIGSDFRDT